MGQFKLLELTLAPILGHWEKEMKYGKSQKTSNILKFSIRNTRKKA